MSIFTIKNRRFSRIGSLMLQRKTWNLLRYIHAREAIQWIIKSNYGKLENVLVIGCGVGLAEISLALEFPDIQFTLTDWGEAKHTTEVAKMFQKKFNIKNVSWSTMDILNPSFEKKYDLVYSIEVLEHIQNDKLAAENMAKLSRNYIFCLIPFAEEAKNQSPSERKRIFELTEHYLVGYNPLRLFNLFPNIVTLRGCYWKEGLNFRRKITNLSLEELDKNHLKFYEEAQSDVLKNIPRTQKDSLGIWFISSNSSI